MFLLSAGTDYKTQVLQSFDIVELIGQTVALKRRGKDFVGLCPFHQEKTPSFHVSPTRQFFHCYGCKAGGNAIDFVMKRDRLEFVEALRLLGRQAGIEMPQFGVSRQNMGEREMLLNAHSAACMLFEKLLSHPQQGVAARDYLARRGFTDESIRRFQIGYVPEAWDTLLRGLTNRKFTPPQLASAGLVKPRNNGDGYYDTFRNRVMFPIRDDAGRVIAFGGRIMPGAEDPAKYLNSPETPLFSKSRCIFGLDLARQKIVESRTVAVVEGYTDVVMAHQYGATNVVSILGTALTEQHVAILRRFADRIVLLFDADTAGESAVNRAVELFLTQPVEIAIASMPEGVDPDEFLLKHGLEAFEKVLADASDALTFKWKQLSRQFQAANDLTGQQKAVEQYLQTLSQARGAGPVDALRWGAALSRVSRLIEIPVEELNRRFRGAKKPASRPVVESPSDSTPETPPPEPLQRPVTAQDRAEWWILGALLVQPHQWHEVQKYLHPNDFTENRRKRLAEIYWDHQRDEGEPIFNVFLGLLEDPALTELAIELVDEVERLPDVEQTLVESVRLFAEIHRQRVEQQKLVAELRRTNDNRLAEHEVDLLRQLQEKARRPDVAGRALGSR